MTILGKPIRRIFHPFDFSAASNLAFAHALKLAVASRGDLTILHAGSRPADSQWLEFPKVRKTLEQWKLLPPQSPKEAISQLGLHVEKVALPYSNPVSSIVHFLSKHPHDLIALATHQYDGFERWTHQHVAEPVARKTTEMTLFIPHEGKGFIDADTGNERLESVLLPVDRLTDPEAAINATTALAECIGSRKTQATLLHVGSRDETPKVHLPEDGDVKWRWMYRDGDVEEAILQAAREYNVDLIVMGTHGHDSLGDTLRGSTTERIVRHAICPVLAAPTDRAAPGISVAEGLATGRITI